MPTAEDLTAKHGFIEAFFEDLEKSVAFTDELHAQGHDDEARLLCCCYIEALGNGLYSANDWGARNFSRVLMDHGEEPTLGLIHPKALSISLPYKSIAPSTRSVLKASFTTLSASLALTTTQLLTAVCSMVPQDALTFLERESWRATIANIAYSNIRSRGVHWFGSPGAVTFSGTTFQGVPVQDVDFSMLRRALGRVLAHAKSLSLTTNKWFGHM